MVRHSITCSLVLTLGLVIFPIIPASAADGSIGKVISIKGKVEFLSGEAAPVADAKPGQVRPVALVPWQLTEPRQPVFPEDQFRTQRKSRLRVLFEDTSLMALGPNSRMKVAHYLYKPEEKLREGVISMAHGMSMYIVNKSQKNKNSSFRIVSPTAAMSARGTQGFMSISDKKTLIANVVGSVEVINSDLSVVGEVVVGAMMKTVVEFGKPPTPPEPLTVKELKLIQTLVLGFSAYGESEGEENSEEGIGLEQKSALDKALQVETRLLQPPNSVGSGSGQTGSGKGSATSQTSSGEEPSTVQTTPGKESAFESVSTNTVTLLQQVYEEEFNLYGVKELESCTSDSVQGS